VGVFGWFLCGFNLFWDEFLNYIFSRVGKLLYRVFFSLSIKIEKDSLQNQYRFNPCIPGIG
jgi:hypothetical protein